MINELQATVDARRCCNRRDKNIRIRGSATILSEGCGLLSHHENVTRTSRRLREND